MAQPGSCCWPHDPALGTARGAASNTRDAAGSSQRDSDCLHVNFHETGAQREVIAGLLSKLCDAPKVEILGHNRDLSHARILDLTWNDGTSLRIGRDQGVGFVETMRRDPT